MSSQDRSTSLDPAIGSAFFGLLGRLWNALPVGAQRALTATMEALATPEGREAATVALDEFVEELQAQIRAYESDPWALVYDKMPAPAGLALLELPADEKEVVLVEILHRALAAPAAVQEMQEVVAEAPISEAQQERLLAGLSALRTPGRTWSVPCDLLLGALEGILWEAAEDEGVVGGGDNSLLRHPKRLHATSVKRIWDEPHGVRLSNRLRRYLDERVFDGTGQRVRHRRSPEAQRAYALYSAVALRAWLDRVCESSLMESAGNRIGMVLQGLSTTEATTTAGEVSTEPPVARVAEDRARDQSAVARPAEDEHCATP